MIFIFIGVVSFTNSLSSSGELGGLVEPHYYVGKNAKPSKFHELGFWKYIKWYQNHPKQRQRLS